MNNQRYFSVGDLHGHYDELMALYSRLLSDARLVPERDVMIFLGDYCDRGLKTKEVIDQLMEWHEMYPHWQFLTGNHESMMIDALDPKHPKYGDYYIWWNQGGQETLKSYEPKDFSEYEKAIMQPRDYIPIEHLWWMRSLIYHYETDDYLFVHAGILPNAFIKEQNLDDPIIQDRMIWIRDEFINSDFGWEKKIIFGHTGNSTHTPIIMKNKIGINTCPGLDGFLTAIELPGEKFYTVPVPLSV